MNNQQSTIIVTTLVIFILGIALLTRSFFVVRTDQFSIVTEFGDPIRTIEAPGLNFLIPFVQEVHYLDKRVRGWDDTARDTKTGETHPIDYTVFARWRINKPLIFYKAVGNPKRAHAAMDSIVTDEIQEAVRSRKVASIVRETGRAFQARNAVNLRSIFKEYKVCDPELNPEFQSDVGGKDGVDSLASTQDNDPDAQAMRSQVVQNILKGSNKRLDEFGIVIEDLHFKYLNYSAQVHGVIIRKIQADRQKDIASYLELGKQCVGYIKGLTDNERGQILAEAERKVREIDGDATAQAIKIKSKAFGKNPAFFQFLKTLELYERTLEKNTRLVLSMDSPLLHLMKDNDIMREVPALPAVPVKSKTQ